MKAISRYTIRNWGADQAMRYLDDIQECVRNVAESPLMGRACDGIKIGYRRVEQGRHVILYRRQPDGIVVARILHQRMLPRSNVIE